LAKSTKLTPNFSLFSRGRSKPCDNILHFDLRLYYAWSRPLRQHYKIQLKWWVWLNKR